ncbi:hypothetical protein DsansV1_C01g0010911 [Dioscorea sansibarensis]
MHRVPATIEEQLILKAIREECPWENLPKRLQATLASKEDWHRRIIDYCIKKRLQWNTCFARKVCKEGEYYEEMMRYLRKNLALYPYHLAEYVCRVMRVSPFKYYCDMIFEVMKSEQPYDSIPNFSAADSLRLTGIGRNEFIDIMNKCRSKKIMWKLNKSIAKELLPTQPVDFSIEPWWGVCLVNFTLEEFKKLTEEEMATIDKVCKEEVNSFVLFDPNIIRGLYRRGLIYFDVPVFPDDRFKVSRLEGFVSNREQSYEDPIEELLYAVFVVSSENATVAELAATLQADLFQLQAAASFACRLGWAIKLIDPESVLQDLDIPGSPGSLLSDDEDGSNVSLNSESVGRQVRGPLAERRRPVSGTAHVAFVVDANITSYLMMGSLSPGLKSHAVTLYEAGKLGDSSIAELCKDLTTLEGKRFEGELQEFANHAFSLRCVLECLQSGGLATNEVGDIIGNQIDKQQPVADEASSLISDIKIVPESLDSGANETGSDAPQPFLDSFGTTGSDAVSVDDGSSVSFSSKDGSSGPINDFLVKDQDNIIPSEGPNNDKGPLKKRRNYRVDVLRCESLAALAPATLERLFLRDYDIIVSMVPLPSSSVLPGPSGPIHFGPPSYSSMTPWMKLVLYTTMESGPLSVVLMKGQCLRVLPIPLAGCEKALIWSWDGSTIGGLGGKFEGNLVDGNVLLHCLNSMLKYSAVLVQPLSQCDLDESERIVTADIALPIQNFGGSIAQTGIEMGRYSEENASFSSLLSALSSKFELLTVGYIRLLRLGKERESDMFLPDDKKYEWVPLSLEFGIPLFNPNLCQRICERVVSSHLLQTDLLAKHHDSMQSLRKMLREVCTEYQATGPSAKHFYHREPIKEPSRQLMNYASGRWSPRDPSTPISEASSEHQRLKLANRQRSRTEVLSFDGSILRSYALAPVYEAATRPIEESSSANASKPESDDTETKEVVLPGVNLLFDGSQLLPFDIAACLQARQPIALIAEASAASAYVQTNRAL